MAIIRFLQSVDLEVSEDYDPDLGGNFYDETFEQGDEYEVGILDEDEDSICVEFDDGTVCLGIHRDLIEFDDDCY